MQLIRTPAVALATFILSLSAQVISPSAQAQQGPDFDAVEFKTTDLGNGFYMLQGFGGNLGVSVGADGVFLIDDDYPQLAEKAVAAVGALADEGVDYLVNTHWHGDHTGGNAAFHATGSRILAHENVRTRMNAAGPRRSPPEALPELTYSENATLHYNGQTIALLHVTNAHTDGDTVVHFREANLIHTGDTLFNGRYPFIDLNSGGSVSGFIDALKLIANLADGDTRIIPGHGPLANKDDVAQTIEMLQATRAAVKTHVDAGKSLEDTLAADPLKPWNDDYAWAFINGERFATILYNDLTR